MSNPAPAAPPPDVQLFQLLFGFIATRAVTAVAELRVADALANGPLYYTALAAAVGADQRALHRTMRTLVALGVFTEPSPGTYALFAALFESAGLKLVAVHPTPSPIGIVEAVKA